MYIFYMYMKELRRTKNGQSRGYLKYFVGYFILRQSLNHVSHFVFVCVVFAFFNIPESRCVKSLYSQCVL